MGRLELEFMERTLRDGIGEILDRQTRVADEKIYGRSSPRSRSGGLKAALASRRYTLGRSGDGFKASAAYPAHIRFIDMKKRQNYRIYNRQVWGVLYGDTISELRFGFRQWFADKVRGHLDQSLNQP